ncbi:aldo/keto reductase [Zymobacter palmae]|uniref:Predicted oxidoreductases n=1 Tax=Zymobacter palmae TaxID=33074 RepID=A0A348HB43_9GAMM|nr:aldo/keto reductase [Zymobacter palmae]BBG28845.1 predicted oxidoreductases [Zymobacter palmae]
MQPRQLGSDLNVSALGLGCMGMSEFYGPRDDTHAMQVLDRAIELGIDFFDTADVYGPYHNETLIGRYLHSRRPSRLKIATKFGIVRKAGEYNRTINNTPAYARACCEASLKRLGIERIDLYYVHRIAADQRIEDTMEGLAQLVKEGKIAHIGLCEVNATTLRRAHAVHPITAVQTEYSLWSREIETDVLPTCRALGIGVVPYSPLGRGFLTGRYQQDSTFAEGDFRAMLPRFQDDNLVANLKLVDVIAALAQQKSCSNAQIALAWLLAQGNDIVPIPGTTRIAHLEDNVGATQVTLTAQECTALSQAIADLPIAGERYTPEGMKGVNG